MSDETNGGGVGEREQHHSSCAITFGYNACTCPATPDADNASEPEGFVYEVDLATGELSTRPAASTGASGGLSEAERRALQAAVRAPQAVAPDMAYVYEAVERIVAARESAAATRARAEEREQIAQAIEANCAHYGDEACCCRASAAIARGDA